jgi:hypothetical protein
MLPQRREEPRPDLYADRVNEQDQPEVAREIEDFSIECVRPHPAPDRQSRKQHAADAQVQAAHANAA